MPREKNDSGSLDMLLDTLCNTFGGILLIALLVSLSVEKKGTQLREETRRDDENSTELLEQEYLDLVAEYNSTLLNFQVVQLEKQDVIDEIEVDKIELENLLEQLKEEGVEYKSGQFPMRALGRSRASMDLDGFVKILADKNTDEVLGIHMIGARCADLIAEGVTAMEFRASAEDISRMSHAHPTFAEAVKEAALAATDDRALHV